MASRWLRFIFQLPAINSLRPGVDPGVPGLGFDMVQASRTARPGSGAPSRYSRDATPPVEMWVTPDSSTPRVRTAAAESPPPTTENELPAAIASATALVPPAKASISNTPTGPFQKTVAAVAMTAAKACRVGGPRARPGQPARGPAL